MNGQAIVVTRGTHIAEYSRVFADHDTFGVRCRLARRLQEIICF
jgi:hypothetical protein